MKTCYLQYRWPRFVILVSGEWCLEQLFDTERVGVVSTLSGSHSDETQLKQSRPPPPPPVELDDCKKTDSKQTAKTDSQPIKCRRAHQVSKMRSARVSLSRTPRAHAAPSQNHGKKSLRPDPRPSPATLCDNHNLQRQRQGVSISRAAVSQRHRSNDAIYGANAGDGRAGMLPGPVRTCRAAGWAVGRSPSAQFHGPGA